MLWNKLKMKSLKANLDVISDGYSLNSGETTAEELFPSADPEPVTPTKPVTVSDDVFDEPKVKWFNFTKWNLWELVLSFLIFEFLLISAMSIAFDLFPFAEFPVILDETGHLLSSSEFQIHHSEFRIPLAFFAVKISFTKN